MDWAQQPLPLSPQTAARAKLSSANLAQATLKAGRRCMLYDPIVDWIFVPGPMQDGSGTPGQVSCSGNGECFVIRRGYKVALPA